MYYERISRTVHLEIGGEDYPLRFSLNVLEQLDGRTGGKLITMATSTGIPPLSTLIDGFWLGLSGAGKKMKREEAEKLAEQFMTESDDGIGALFKTFATLVAVSGLLGAKASHEILEQMGVKDEDGDPAGDEKNVRQAKNKSK